MENQPFFLELCSHFQIFRCLASILKFEQVVLYPLLLAYGLTEIVPEFRFNRTDPEGLDILCQYYFWNNKKKDKEEKRLYGTSVFHYMADSCDRE